MGRYIGRVVFTWRNGGIFSWLLLADWVAFPFAVHTVIHPDRALNLQNWFQGRAIEAYFTNQALFAGTVMAVVGLIALFLFQLGVTVMIYRRAGDWVSIWPVAALFIAVIGNLVWWVQTGRFDMTGALIGTMPFASGIICQIVCEKWGADFVFGKGNRPEPIPGLHY